MEFEARPSRPEDAASVAPLIYSSGPYSFDYVLGCREPESLQFIQTAFGRTGGELQYKNHQTILSDGSIVACGAVLSPQQTLLSTVQSIRHLIRHFGFAASLPIARRGLAFEKVVQPPSKGLWIIAHLGVTPRLRGQGIGAKLIDHLVGVIRENGGRRVGLDVALINPQAEALYRRIGFQVTAERKSKLANPFGTVPDFKRMEMDV